jgi:hypothetical protein
MIIRGNTTLVADTALELPEIGNQSAVGKVE